MSNESEKESEPIILKPVVTTRRKSSQKSNDPGELSDEGRGHWNGHVEYILASLGYAVGIGNLWRYPYLVYENGGGAFVLASFILMILVAFPTFLYEQLLGQFTSRGPIHIWRHLLPAFEGVGWANYVVNVLASVYYNVIFGYAVFYMFSSVTSPWVHCHSPWNSESCFSIEDYQRCMAGHSNSQRWYIKRKCYAEANITDFDQKVLTPCIQRPNASYADPNNAATWKCSFTLTFNLTRGTFGPCQLFGIRDSNSTQCTESADPYLYGNGGILDTYDTCYNRRARLRSRESIPLGQPKLFQIDLEHRKLERNGTKEIVLRAENLRKLIAEMGKNDTAKQQQQGGGKNNGTTTTRITQKNSTQVFDIAFRYCKHLYEVVRRQEHWTRIDCLRSVMDPDESYSSEEYYRYSISSSTPGDTRRYYWPVPLALGLAWISTAAGLIKGTDSLGKFVYVTAVTPLIMIVILDIIATTLPGYEEGIKYYTTTEWCKWKNPKLWMMALSQLFFSTSVGSGGLSNMASYNRFENDVVRDALIVAMTNYFFCFIGGFGVFGVVGYMARQVSSTVPNVLRGSSEGIAFVVFAQAACNLPGGQVLAFFFYLTLCLLAIDSQFAQVDTILTYIYDEYPKTRKRKWAVCIIVCGVLYLAGIPMCNRGGKAAVVMLDAALFTYTVPLLALTSLIGSMWIYGVNNIIRDSQMMFGRSREEAPHRVHIGNFFFTTKIKWYMLISWTFLAPSSIISMVIANFSSSEEAWAPLLGAPILLLVLVGPIWSICWRHTEHHQLLKPHVKWGPATNKFRGRDVRYECFTERTVSSTSLSPSNSDIIL